MTGSPLGPRLIRGGIVLVDPATLNIARVLPLQYNAETITRSLTPQTVGQTGGDRLEALRLKGPPQETIRVEIEFDATDWLDAPQQPGMNDVVSRYGLLPQLSALEMTLYPSADKLVVGNTQAQAGILEIAPMEAPLTLFVWSRHRVVPVRLTEVTVTEEAFDTSLQPVRARVNLAMRVLSVSDIGFTGPGDLYLQYQRRKQMLSEQLSGSGLGTLGISTIRGG